MVSASSKEAAGVSSTKVGRALLPATARADGLAEIDLAGKLVDIEVLHVVLGVW